MFNIKLAGLSIGITCRYDTLPAQCRNYITDLPAQFTVFATEEDLAREAELCDDYDYKCSTGYLESVAVYRAICRKLPEYSAFMFHSAVVEKGGVAFALAGKSGAGKSTQAAFWVEALQAEIINGDKPIFRFFGDDIYACGTPWAGKENQNNNMCVPLKAIFLVKKADENYIEPVSAYDAVPLCLKQILMPEGYGSVETVLDLLDKMLAKVPVFKLYCRKEPEAAKAAYKSIEHILKG